MQDEKLENDVYQEISLTASAFAYSWSKWNAESGEDKIVLQTTEQLQDEMLLEVSHDESNVGDAIKQMMLGT